MLFRSGIPPATEAQFNLGIIFLKENSEYNHKLTALKWFSLAAKQGLPEAQYNFASIYFDGEGVVQDFKVAYEYYLMSAENGFRESQYQLSKMFFNGWGIKKDIVKSFMWANISASQGYEKAIIKRDNLITMLSNTEVQKAQKLSLDCFSKKFKNC